MKKFEVYRFCKLIRESLKSGEMLADLDVHPELRPVVPHSRALIETLVGLCREADLPVSVAALRRTLALFGLSYKGLADSLDESVTRAIVVIEDEISSKTFLSLGAC